MLKNKDLEQISKAKTLLCVIWQYSIDSNELYEKTGITTKDIHDCMKALNYIRIQETLKHLRANEKANAWNKANPEKHRKYNREYERRKHKSIKQEEVK